MARASATTGRTLGPVRPAPRKGAPARRGGTGARRDRRGGRGRRGPRFGVLQAVIGIGVLTLSVRVGALYEDLNSWVAGIEVGRSQALAVETQAPASAAQPLVQLAANEPEAPARAGPEAEPTGPATPGGGPSQPTLGAPDLAAEAAAGLTPPGFTQSEINLLQRLAERREELDAVERELDSREAFLKAAEGRIETRIGELKDLEGVIRALLADHDEQEQARIDQLVSIYATMKPKDAARIFNDLQMPILLTVIENMKERSSAAILAEMTPERAKEVTTELARRKHLPGDDPLLEDAGAALR